MTNYSTAALEIIRMSLWNHRLQNALAREVDLPVYQLECLLVLHFDHPDSAGELAEILGIRKSSLSRLLSALQKRDLIARALGDEDRRTERLSLTDAGVALVERVQTRTERIAATLLELLVPERRSQFISCLRTITANDVPVEGAPSRRSLKSI